MVMVRAYSFPRIAKFQAELQNFANWPVEFGKICHRKLWALAMWMIIFVVCACSGPRGSGGGGFGGGDRVRSLHNDSCGLFCSSTILYFASWVLTLGLITKEYKEYFLSYIVSETTTNLKLKLCR